MGRLFLLLFALVACQLQVQAQACVPDPDLADAAPGLYPPPFNPDTRPTGGIGEAACAGMPYEFTFNLVAADSVDIGGGTMRKVTDVILSTLSVVDSDGNVIDLSALGLSYNCNPNTCIVPGGTVGCLHISGNIPATVAPGFYELVFSGSTTIENFGTLNLTLPDQTNFPGDQYILEVRGTECVPLDCDLRAEVETDAATCFSSTDGSATVTTTGATGTVTYQWDDNAGNQTTATATGLGQGNYMVTVSDDTGCEIELQANVGTGLGAVEFTVNKDSDASCNEGGQATIIITSGVAPFQYTWSDDPTRNDSIATDLDAGNYMVTVTDDTGCTGEGMVTIESATTTLEVMVSATDAACAGDSTGTAMITVTGGNDGATFLWSTGDTTAMISNLPAGMYSVTVTKEGCDVMESVEIGEGSSLMLDLMTVDSDCEGGDNGTAAATVTGGSGDYTYAWSGLAATTANVGDLAPGDYSLTVTDTEGCSLVETFSIGGSDTPPDFDIIESDATCNGLSDGLATLLFLGDTTGLMVSWSTGETGISITGLSAGDYEVTVELDGCTVTRMFDIGEPEAIVTNIASVDISCDFVTIGEVSANPTGGAGGYTYNWSNGSTESSQFGVGVGEYILTVTDSDGCSVVDTTTVVIEELELETEEFIGEILCSGDATGSVVVNIIGGNDGFTFAWSSGETVNSITDKTAGVYSYTIMDSRGCIFTDSVTIDEPDALTVMFDEEIAGADCNAGLPVSLTAVAAGGTGNLNYNWSTGATTATIGELESETYTVTVTDENGCTAVDSIAVTTDGNAFSVSTTVTEVTCSGNADGTIQVLASGGSGSYDYMWSIQDIGNTALVDNLSAGTYTVTVSDGGDCSDTLSVTLDNPDPISFETTIETVSCGGAADGGLTLTPTGGEAPYTYEWSHSGTDTASFDNLMAGSYIFTLTDNNNCGVVDSIIITEPEPIDITTRSIGAGCGGQLPDAVESTVTGGDGNYTYAWSNGSGQSTLNNPPEGIYTLVVTDGMGCMDSVQVVVDDREVPLELSSMVTNVDCNDDGSDDGSATVMVDGGSGNYTFNWSNGEETQTITDLRGGTYTVTVSDDTGCLDSLTVEILDPGPFNVGLNVNNVSCFGDDNGRVILTTSRGTPEDFIYAWSDGSNQSSRTGLAGGDYTVTVTELISGCTISESVNIVEPDSIGIQLSGIREVSCNDGNDGFIEVNISGGAGILTVEWSNGSDTTAVEGLRAGDYIITVTDRNNCDNTATFTVGEPDPIEITVTPTNQIIGNDGTATANVTGGTAPYSYDWIYTSAGGAPVGSNTDSVGGLFGGQYTLIVQDANGCQESTSFEIGGATCAGLVDLTFDAEPVDCNENLGSASVFATGGNAPYIYVWSTGDSTTVIDSLDAGEYRVTVTDSDGCPSVGTVEVEDLSQFGVTLAIDDVTCVGLANGSITAIPGGMGPFTYDWDTGNFEDSTRTITDLSPGTYTVVITNGAGCTQTVSGVVRDGGADGQLEAEITSRVNVSCPGDSDGATSITATGGEAPYTFSWVNQGTDETFMGDSLSNLAVGTYLVTATDVNGCEVATSVEIAEPDSIMAEVLVNSIVCATDSSGTAGVNVLSGGTAPFSFAWSTGDSTQGIFGLGAGMYTVTVTDDRGCSNAYSAEILAGDSILIEIVEVTNETSAGADDGTATISVTGGNEPYSYEWDNGDTSETATGLSPGLHTVTVTDVNGCEATATVNVNEDGCSLKVDITRTNISCNGANDGSATASIEDSSGELTFEWSTGSSDATIGNLIPGTYDVTVTDETGCIAEDQITITEPNAIQVSISSVVNLDCDGNGGEATATGAGGSGTFTYEWSTGETTATATELEMGENTVTVTDENGCSEVETVEIIQDSGFDANVVPIGISCCGESDGTVRVDIVGVADDFTFDFGDGITSDGNTASGLAAGDYTVVVSDEDGCSSTFEFTIEDAVALEAMASVTSPIICTGDSSAVVSVDAMGGNGNYTYTWSTGDDTAEVSGLPAGDYVITVTDFNGCEVIVEATVTQADEALTATIDSQNESAEDANDGRARVNVTGGSGDYRYEWNDPNNTDTPTITGLAPGDYEVTITDSNGCEVVLSLTIEAAEDACPTYSINIDAQGTSCPATADGRAEVVGISDSTEMVFTYLWSNGDTTAVADSLEAGMYTVTITDALGCPGEASVMIVPMDSLDLTANVNGVGCVDGGDGQATINVAGGMAPYTYNWSTDTLGGNMRDTLDMGSYVVTVTDANGCASMIDFEIEMGEDNTAPVIEVRELTVYLDEFGEANFEMDSLIVSITDNCALDSTSIEMVQFGCDNVGMNEVLIQAFDMNDNLAEMRAPVMVLDTTAPFLDCLAQDTLITDCLADRTISFELPQVLDNCGASLTPVLVSGLESGSVFPPGLTEQTFEVMDSSGNVATCTFMVDIDVLGVEIEVDEPTCFGFANGSLIARPINETGNVFFNWDTGSSDSTLMGLAGGTYTVTVVDDAGCSRVEEVTLTEPDLLTIEIDSFIRATDDEANASIFVTVEGGSQPYNYQWTKDGTELILDVEDLVNVEAGEYRLTVFDANGCTVVSGLVKTPTNEIAVNYSVQVQPNPTSGELFIQIDQPKALPQQYALYDMTGRLVRQWEVDATIRQEQNIDLSAYDDGIYLLRIQIENDVLTKRIVLMKN
ncbi:MAG: T9SS type A sorting domain-containing protein [Bacteroidota bacterium]